MSEQGWINFLHAEGVDDWVVLHGGATAVFPVGSLLQAVELAGAFAQAPGLEGSGALFTVADVDVSVAREHVEARLAAAVAAGGRIVDDSAAPEAWILADRAGNKVCIAAWPDGAMRPGR